jgi:hypothetical protein
MAVLIVSSAAQLAMLILKNGGSALDAVEAAIKTLEDREITNAGYGSNLAMDGVVECDASVVDHFGRSGAVGAVARKSLTTIAHVAVLTDYNRDQEPYAVFHQTYWSLKALPTLPSRWACRSCRMMP